jgi:transcriptional regulator with XRE-family HTH domain
MLFTLLPMTTTKTLAQWMRANDLGDAQVAEMVGFDRSTISRVRRGDVLPSWELAAALYKVSHYAVSPVTFLPKTARTKAA